MDNRLGVLGGMGPQATNTFYQYIIDRTEARTDQDHINTLILSDCQMPDRTGAILGTEAERVFLTAVDLPFAEPKLAESVLEALECHQACCLRWPDGRLEPLFAAYRRSCLPAVQACLEEGRRSFRGLLERVDCRYLTPQALGGTDLAEMLLNVNTPEELCQAEGKI